MKKKLPQSSRCCSPLLLPCETKTLHPLHRKTEPAPLAMKGSRLCVFTSGSFAYDHFQLNDINSDFLFALGAKKRKIHQNGIRIHFGSRFAVAYGGTNPQRIISFFIHVYTSDYGIALRSTSGIFHYLLSKLGCMGFECTAGL